MTTVKNKQESDHQQADRNRSVYIDTVGVDMLAFDLSDSDKRRLIESGKEGVRTYFHPEQAHCVFNA